MTTSPEVSTTPPLDRTVLVPIPKRREEPQIEVLREGDVLKTIRVSCPCGCVVDIDCQYNTDRDLES